MSDDGNTSGHASYQMRACEHCRQRKIKCDRKAPCASCRSLHIECRPSARSATVRARLSNSGLPGPSDKQMSSINQRLASIEDSLKRLATASALSPSQQTDQSPGSNLDPSASNVVPTIDGEISFESQTMQAGEAASNTVAAFGDSSNAQLRTAITSLISSLEAHNLDSRAHEAYLSSVESVTAPEALPLPPADLVSAMTKKYRSRPGLMLANLFSRSMAYLEGLCQRCYFPIAPLPSGSHALLFGLLFFSIRDHVHEDDSPYTSSQLQPILQLCERNFYKSVETYTSLTVPTFENAAALFLAAVRAHEESKVHLVWTYVSACATMCYSLGWHRRSALATDTVEEAELKRQVFWNVYMLDKNLCLNLGRRSNFCDDDIDQELYPISEDPRQAPLDDLNNMYIRYAVLQGQAYDELFSPKGVQRSPAEKRETITSLEARMLQLSEDTKKLDFTHSWYPNEMSAMLASVDAMAFTTLTTIHRAQTNSALSTEISSECFAYAKAALEAHVRFARDYVPDIDSEQRTYVYWVLLYASFTPYVIHFTWTLSTLNPLDLELLEQAVAMLDRVKHISKGSRRLHSVCSAFMETARVLVQTQHSLSGFQQHDNGSLMFTDTLNTDASANADWSAWSQAFPAVDRSTDVSLFLNNWLGDGRPVLDMLDLDTFNRNAAP